MGFREHGGTKKTKIKYYSRIKMNQWDFIEKNYPNYSSCDDVLYSDLLEKYIKEPEEFELDENGKNADIIRIEKDMKEQNKSAQQILDDYRISFIEQAIEAM